MKRRFLMLSILFGIFFVIAGCDLFKNNSEEDNGINRNKYNEVILERVHPLNWIFDADFYNKGSYVYFTASSQFEVILNPPKDSINSLLTFKIIMPGGANYQLYYWDKIDKLLHSWVCWGDVSLKSTREDKKLLDVIGYDNVFISAIFSSLQLVYQGHNIRSSDAKRREVEYYETYKMLQLNCILDNIRKSGNNFSFKQINTEDGTSFDLSNVYFHHDFTNPDGTANSDSLKSTVNMWNNFSYPKKNLELEVIEIPVQLVNVWAEINLAYLPEGVEIIDRNVISIPLSIHR